MSVRRESRSVRGTRSRVAVAAVAALALAGCAAVADEGAAPAAAGEDGAEEAMFDLSGQEVRIGTAAEQALDIGTSYGVDLLAEWGADVEREELTNLSGLEAIVADRVDVSGRSSDEVIDGNSRGVELVAFGASASTMHYTLIAAPDSGIEDVSDLAGKQLAIGGPANFDFLLTAALLEQEGIAEEDVTFIPIGGSGERTAAVLAGQADASLVFMDNWLALEEQESGVTLVGYVADLLPGISSRAYAAERSWLEENEEMALAIACANLEANAWINEDEQAYVEFTNERVTGTTPEGVAAFHRRALELEMFPLTPAEIVPVESFQGTADLMFEAGAIETEVDAADFVDISFLEEAAEMGCGAA